MLKSYEIIKTEQFGRGLYATTVIKKDQIIDENPMLAVPKYLHRGILAKYVFAYKRNGQAIALGNISLTNHSKQPNCDYFYVEKGGIDYIRLVARRKIEVGEQLFIDYGYTP